MKGINRVIVAGNLGQAPELQVSKKGVNYSRLRVATEKFSLIEGEWQKSTNWHSIFVFGKKAEICQKYLAKGAAVAVEGYMDSGSEHPKIVAEDIHFFDPQTAKT